MVFCSEIRNGNLRELWRSGNVTCLDRPKSRRAPKRQNMSTPKMHVTLSVGKMKNSCQVTTPSERRLSGTEMHPSAADRDPSASSKTGHFASFLQ